MNDGEPMISKKSKNEGNKGRVSAPRSRNNSQKSNSIEDKFKKAFENKELSNFKRDELKEFLTLKSLPANGKKNFLVEMVE